MKWSHWSSSLLVLARHALCVLALMWTGLVNGQPFLFQSDTTNYVRAADAAVYIVSGHRISTVWTDRYREQLSSGATPRAAAQVGDKRVAPESANDVRGGLIMGGRSPYIGALMYLAYVAGNFWPFVLFQAIVATILINLTARRFGITKPAEITALTLFLAATTSLPTYNSLLMADAFASFGILAFLLLATPGKLSRLETIFLGAVLAISVVAHLTHEMMLLGMVVALGVLALLRWRPRPPARAWVAGIGAGLLGVTSVIVTSFATQMAFGHPPQMLPLLTARFIADGPGKAYIDSGCNGRRFTICRISIGDPHSDVGILFGRTPAGGAYMLANADERRLMGQEDVPFALAVLRYDFAGETAMMARNTLRQLLYIDYDGLNQDCFDQPDCWTSLPTPVRAKLQATPSGRGKWSQPLMNVVQYIAVLGSLLCLAWVTPYLRRSDPDRWQLLRNWLLVGFAAMLACCFFGGAVADPQYRYQGRLIWLLPLMSGIALLVRRQCSAVRETAHLEVAASDERLLRVGRPI
jgi:hypothetical protein